MKIIKSLLSICSLTITFSVFAYDEAANEKCSKAMEKNEEIYQNCWGYDQNIISLNDILKLKETIEIINSGSVVNKVGHVRSLLLSILPGYQRREVDVVTLQFAIDLYHTLPPGTNPPPSDITPTVIDKGLLWRFDEPLGEFGSYCHGDKLPQMKRLCRYYFNEGNLDAYTENGRIKYAVFPSENQNKVLKYMGLNETNSIIKLKRYKPDVSTSYRFYKHIKNAAKRSGCVETTKVLWENYQRDFGKDKQTFEVICESSKLEIVCDRRSTSGKLCH